MDPLNDEALDPAEEDQGFRRAGVGDVSGDVEVTHRFLFAEAEQGTVVVSGGECMTKQVVGDPGHGLAATLSFPLEGADYVVGKARAVEGAWHDTNVGFIRNLMTLTNSELHAFVVAGVPGAAGFGQYSGRTLLTRPTKKGAVRLPKSFFLKKMVLEGGLEPPRITPLDP